jgi:hypothetical protein
MQAGSGVSLLEPDRAPCAGTLLAQSPITPMLQDDDSSEYAGKESAEMRLGWMSLEDLRRGQREWVYFLHYFSQSPRRESDKFYALAVDSIQSRLNPHYIRHVCEYWVQGESGKTKTRRLQGSDGNKEEEVLQKN